MGYRLELDHSIPSIKCGETSNHNLALAGVECSRAKGPRTTALNPVTGREARLFNLRLERREDRFRWSATYRSIFGKTAMGRTTVAALHLDDQVRRRVRVHWRRLGLTP